MTDVINIVNCNIDDLQSLCPFFTDLLSNEEYHAMPGLSSSAFKAFCQSPAKYKEYLAKKNDEEEDKPALILGTLIHTMVLEPHKKETDVFVLPELNLRTNAGKAEKEALFLEHTGKQVVTPEQMLIAEDVARRVKADPTCQALFASGVAERSYFWIDDCTGLLCKCRPDWINFDLPAMVDIKSTDDCSEGSFARDVEKYWYDVQSAWYLRGVVEVTGTWVNNFSFVACEKKNPFMPPMIYIMDGAYLETADLLINHNLKRLRDFISGDLKYLGYGDSNIRSLTQPTWSRRL
jgi:hypothetical protein